MVTKRTVEISLNLEFILDALRKQKDGMGKEIIIIIIIEVVFQWFCFPKMYSELRANERI